MGSQLTFEIQEAVLHFSLKYSNDSKKLILICEALHPFTNIDEIWITTICLISDIFSVKPISRENLTSNFGSSFLNNMGSKSKSGVGIPYSEDVLKKELLEKIIFENKFSSSVIEFLGLCLLKVNEDISREIENDKKETNW